MVGGDKFLLGWFVLFLFRFGFCLWLVTLGFLFWFETSAFVFFADDGRSVGRIVGFLLIFIFPCSYSRVFFALLTSLFFFLSFFFLSFFFFNVESGPSGVKRFACDALTRGILTA